MTRLTKEIREIIARDCVKTQFQPVIDKLKKEEAALGLKCYREAFDAPTRKLAQKLPKKWLRQDECLRFNCGGYDITFSVKEAVPVPYSTNCSRLANITGDLAAECQDFAQRLSKVKSEAETARQKLMSLLNAMNTIKSLEKAWPEGKKFYQRYAQEKEGTGLPAVMVADINKALGL